MFLLNAGCCHQGTQFLTKTRWQGDRSLITGVVYGDGSTYEGQDADPCVHGWGLVADTGAGHRVSVPGTLPFLIQDVDGAELFGFFMFLRIARAPVQYVTDSRFVARLARRRGQTSRLEGNRCLGALGRQPLRAEGQGAHHC